jgi:glucose/arabinose dehydrogenase
LSEAAEVFNLNHMVKSLSSLFRFAFISCLFALIVGTDATTGLANSPVDTAVNANEASPHLILTPFAGGFNSPVGIVGSRDGRLFVLEREGVIRTVLPDGSIFLEPFLDISARVDASSSEEGLLGLALHPDFASNGYFYLNYVNTTLGVRRTRISRFKLTEALNLADPESEEIFLTIEQPFGNHNGGHILFGPDGFLYIPLGDGGGGGDPGNRAQDVNTLLGKIARIDIDSNSGVAADCVGLGSGNYRVPAGNPMVDGSGGACDEMWDLGLRNPWRASFDRKSGDLYIGDVGQNSWEEIDYHPADILPGQNFGWRCYEGNHPFNTIDCGPGASYTSPIFEYSQEGNGCSVIAGYVYRGRRFPAIEGHFFLTDYCSGNFWELVPNGSGSWNSVMHANLRAFGYVAFGEGCDGELYLANIDDGAIYRLGVEGESARPTAAHTLAAQAPNTIQLESWLYLPILLSDGCR